MRRGSVRVRARVSALGLQLGIGIGFRVTGTFAPKNFRSRERKFHGMELSLP